MNKEEAIKFLRQLYPNGGHCWLDYQRMEAIRMAINALQEEPANDDLKKAAENYAFTMSGEDEVLKYNAFIEGAQWQKEHSWKPADGDDLPEIDREVIALLDNGKVVFAHRPSEHWDGKNIDTGKVTRYYPKTYDKGGWNIPNLKYWLDYPLPE
jgi:hypothetical protein